MGKSLEQWLESKIDNHSLNLTLQYIEVDDGHFVGLAYVDDSYYIKDPEYLKFIPQFMMNPNLFLNNHPEITSLVLNDCKGLWMPKNDLPRLAENYTLHSISLSNNGLDSEDANTIALNPRLYSLNLSNNNIGNVFGSGLINCEFHPNLRNLSIRRSNLTGKDISSIATIPHLVSLDVSNNNLNDASMIALQNKQFKRLNVSNNNINAKGLSYIVNNASLDSLNVAQNQIDATGAAYITKLSNLKRLDISHNPLHRQAGVDIASQLTQLNTVDFSRTKIRKDTVHALLHNPNLKNAHVSWFEVGPFHKFKLWRYTHHNKELTQPAKQGFFHHRFFKHHQKSSKPVNKPVVSINNKQSML